MSAGVFITFEGIDGAGKSTHIEALAALFQRQGRGVTVTREPGGTPLAERLRELVLNEGMDPLTEALLVFAARRDHLVRVIEPALLRGEVVLCDRFTDSSFAYQGGGQGLALEVLQGLEHWVQDLGEGAEKLRQPDLSLLFVLSPAQAAARLSQARAPDKFEAKGVDFFARVTAGYAARAREFPMRFRHIQADRERDAVWVQVEEAVRAAGWLA